MDTLFWSTVSCVVASGLLTSLRMHESAVIAFILAAILASAFLYLGST